MSSAVDTIDPALAVRYFHTYMRQTRYVHMHQARLNKAVWRRRWAVIR